MAILLSLPDEILLRVAAVSQITGIDHPAITENYTHGTLHSLALTCKRLYPIAANTLYGAPCLAKVFSDDHKPCAHRLFLFIRTLLRQPCLAEHVRDLTFTTGYGFEEFRDAESWAEMLDQGIKAIWDIGKVSDDWRQRVNDWVQRLEEADDAAWGGLLISICPRLEALTMEILSTAGLDSDRNYGKRYAKGPLAKLFGSSEVLTEPDLSPIPGLQSLKILTLYGHYLNWSWFGLPKLADVQVCRECALPIAPSDSQPSQLKYLELECPTSIFNPRVPHESFRNLIEGLDPRAHPKLRKLQLYFTNCWTRDARWIDEHGVEVEGVEDVDILQYCDQGRCATLLQRISRVAKTLEELFLGLYWDFDADHLDYIAPVGTFAYFDKLKILCVPQELLLGRDYGLPGQVHRPLHAARLLPHSLEEMMIMCPTLHVRTFLQELLDSKANFAAFKKLELYTRSDRGDDYPVIRWDSHAIWQKLRDAGIEIEVTYREIDEKPEWLDRSWEDEAADNVLELSDFLYFL
ncbi:hypothetical protein BDV96DRAFT_104706 [Lophiotrema nucula]|uniref:Uncharacterized protein n=1 Tax=Lophiotrema nucula TaxID=690887 RepID=A0A6A5Z6F6_9PLEO|nr:hypothetical protein BDV96DRAFT_104706 [Lophiotrema nucula]